MIKEFEIAEILDAVDNLYEIEKKKRKISEKRAKQIIDSQMPDFEKQKLADVNIENNTSLENLYEKLENLLQIIKKMKHRNIKRLIEI